MAATSDSPGSVKGKQSFSLTERLSHTGTLETTQFYGLVDVRELGR